MGRGVRNLTALLFCATASWGQNGPVQVREDKLTLATYDEGAPDVNPQFATFYGDIFPNYPYTIRTVANNTRRRTSWRILVLENDYLSCRVLPDLGGHLHGCTDRITGKEIFYANPAVRRTGENPRNSFIAAGIESNFPIAHSRVDSSPVNFSWAVKDGAGTVVVEDTDRVSGMTWRVEFTLRPGSAVLEQHVALYNGSEARRGYQWWTNAAIELDDPHTRLLLPTKWMAPHGNGTMTSWPKDLAGNDLSDISAFRTQTDLFAHGSHEPWMAIYKPQSRRGVAHYADAGQVKGKKIWLWGTSDQYVQDNLTDKFNSYFEIQAGELESQAEFAFLLPAQTKTFTHYWIPFHDLGGVSRVTPDAVLNLSRGSQNLLVEVEATRTIQGAKIRLSDSAKVLSETPADLDPRTKFTTILPAPPPKVTVDIVDSAGKVLLHHVEDEYDALPFDMKAKNPEPAPPSNRSDTEAAALARGTYDEQRDNWKLAWTDYQIALQRMPGSSSLQLAAGRAAFVLNRYDEAAQILRDLVPTSGEAAYYYGAALANESPPPEEAHPALLQAAKDPLYGTAARLEAALLAARALGDPGKTEALATLQALASAPGAPVRIGALEVAMLRRAGNTDEARKRLEFWLAQDPANDLLRVERSKLGGAEDAALWEQFAGNPSRLLGVAEDYYTLGAIDDAVSILDRRYAAVSATESEPGTALPQDNPLVVYFRGFCREELGQDSAADYKLASSLSTKYIFPHRAVFFRILLDALDKNPYDAVANDLLGDLYFDSLRVDPAISYWKKALQLKKDLPATARNLGRALLDIKDEPIEAGQVLRAGKSADPGNADLIATLNRIKDGPVMPQSPGSNASPPPAPGGQATFDLTPAAFEDVAGQALLRAPVNPLSAVSLFTPAAFPKEKQPDNVRRAYIEVQVQNLLAMARGGKCGDAITGLDMLGNEDRTLPFTLYSFAGMMRAAHFQYFVGNIQALCGNLKAAQKVWNRVARSTEAVDSPDYVFPLLAAMRLGEPDAGQKMNAALQALQKQGSPFTRGVLLLATGKKAEAQPLLQESLASPDVFIRYLGLTILVERWNQTP